MLDALRLASVLLTALTMATAIAHLLELPAKMGLSREDYLIVQQIYRGWALLGIVVMAALIATASLAAMSRNDGAAAFGLPLAATISIALSLVIFFVFIHPANQATSNWTRLPENWQALRRQWEYSHAANALLYFVALAALTLSLVLGRR